MISCYCKRPIAALFLGICAAAACFAEPKSPAAREAAATHEAALKQASDVHTKAVADADAAYLAALKAALLKAAEAKDTDEVMAIGELIKAQESLLAPPPAQTAAPADDKNDLFAAPDARRVVYLCDASGSMQAVFGALRKTIKSSVDGLKPTQSFNVVFYSGDNVVPFNKGGLIQPTADIKRKLGEWVDGIAPKEGTNPVPAIQKAFSFGPDTIFVLTDGFDQTNDFTAITKEFSRLNPQKRVKVNTILLTSDALASKALADLLDRIATENGGRFTTVTREEFSKENGQRKKPSIFPSP